MPQLTERWKGKQWQIVQGGAATARHFNKTIEINWLRCGKLSTWFPLQGRRQGPGEGAGAGTVVRLWTLRAPSKKPEDLSLLLLFLASCVAVRLKFYFSNFCAIYCIVKGFTEQKRRKKEQNTENNNTKRMKRNAKGIRKTPKYKYQTS